MFKWLGLLILASLLGGLALTSTVQAEEASGKIIVKSIGAAEVEKLVTANRGKVIILDIWATWCPPCRREIPGFMEIAKAYAKQGVVVIGLAADEGGPSVVQPFVDENQINYPIYSIGEEVLSRYGIEAFPTTLIYDRQGKLVKQHIGFRPREEFEAEIKPLLK
jgi:thiol-disulfide isomerase/thioredoxin